MFFQIWPCSLNFHRFSYTLFNVSWHEWAICHKWISKHIYYFSLRLLEIKLRPFFIVLETTTMRKPMLIFTRLNPYRFLVFIWATFLEPFCKLPWYRRDLYTDSNQFSRSTKTEKTSRTSVVDVIDDGEIWRKALICFILACLHRQKVMTCVRDVGTNLGDHK